MTQDSKQQYLVTFVPGAGAATVTVTAETSCLNKRESFVHFYNGEGTVVFSIRAELILSIEKLPEV